MRQGHYWNSLLQQLEQAGFGPYCCKMGTRDNLESDYHKIDPGYHYCLCCHYSFQAIAKKSSFFEPPLSVKHPAVA